jgi:hypothetical protein
MSTAISTVLSLDTSLLGSLYLPLEQTGGNTTGWNDGTSAYFISQGSEYLLGQPTTTPGTTTLSQTQIDNIQTGITKLTTALNASATPTNQAEVNELVNNLTVWVKGLYTGETVDILTVTAPLTHIRNNQGDDKATLTLTYAWVPALGVAVPVAVDVYIDWAGSLQGVDTGLKTFDSALKVAELEEEFIDSVLAGLEITGASAAFTFFSVATFALAVVAGVTKMLINIANDGGRVNFVAVIAHAVNRITACIQPAPPAPGNLQLPTVNLNGLGYTWINTQNSSIFNGNTFIFPASLIAGTYPVDCVPGNTEEEEVNGVLINDFDMDALYPVGSPELSWSLNGAGMILSSKIEVDANGETIYAVAMMIFNHAGQLARVSTFMQDGASSGSLVVPDPISYSASCLTPDPTACGIYPLGEVIAAEFSQTESYQPSSLQLEWVIPEVMIAFQNNIVMTTPPSENWAKMVQPSTGYSISWINGSPSYDTGQHCTIGVDGNNNVLQIHEGGSSNIYSDVGTISGNSISWPVVGKKRSGGDWPTVAVRSNGTFLEIHSGSTVNLYWETGTVSSSGVSWDQDDGTYISDGNHPGMAMNASNLVVVMFLQGNDDLQYNIGQLSGSGDSTAIAWNKTLVDYASGDHASLILAGDGCIVEVHSQGGYIYYNIGTASSDSIDWNSADPINLYVKGDHTGLALRSDGLVCLVYDNNSVQYYGLGVLDAANKQINWITLNNEYVGGGYGTVAFAPNGQVIETHQSSTSDETLWWNIGTVTTP